MISVKIKTDFFCGYSKMVKTKKNYWIHYFKGKLHKLYTAIMSKDLIAELFYHLGNKFRLHISFSTGLFCNIYHTSVSLLLRQQFCMVLLLQQILWAWMPISLPFSFFFFPFAFQTWTNHSQFSFWRAGRNFDKMQEEKKKKKSIYFVLETISSKEYTIHLLEQQQKK